MNKYKNQTANELINVLDIRDKIMYSRDGLMFSYVRITPVSLELLSQREKTAMAASLTAQLSRIDKPFKLIALSRPIDITPLIDEYAYLLSQSDDEKQRQLLRSETRALKEYMNSGDVTERLFYIILWEKYTEYAAKDFIKRASEFAQSFQSSGIRAEVIKEDEIIRLINMVNNPAYVHLEDTDYTERILRLSE